MVEVDLREVIDGCRRGHQKSQQQLFNKYAKLFYAVSRRYSPLHLDPMDNLHDGFIKIFENINTFDEKRGCFEAWGRRIIINCALQKLKKKSQTHETYPEYINDHQTDLFDVVGKLSVDELYKKIEELPDGYRQVFCLYEIEGYSHKEIGEMLGIQEVSSRSNLSRSKKLLQSLLAPDSEDYRSMLNAKQTQ